MERCVVGVDTETPHRDNPDGRFNVPPASRGRLGALFLLNRDAQAEVGTRQQFIRQSVQLDTLYREIVKALAELAVKNSDSQVMQMLASQGINVSVNAPAASATGSAASGARK